MPVNFDIEHPQATTNSNPNQATATNMAFSSNQTNYNMPDQLINILQKQNEISETIA
jgi:hypothetical protein